MAVTARFRCTGYTAGQSTRERLNDDKSRREPREFDVVEIRTVLLSPVYGGTDTTHPNYQFWEASPSGKIELGTINPAAWKQFEMGKVYDITFTEAPPDAQ